MEKDLVKAVQDYVDAGVKARSVPFMWEDNRYWIKISLKSQANFWHKVQNFFATVFGVQMLRATVSFAGEEGLKAECRRLERIAKRDVLVPKVIAQRPGWILLSDIGPSLHQELQGAEDKETLLVLAASSLAHLHQQGGWHGTGQLRDMIYSGEQVGYIDFEENVGEAMDVAAAQGRDVLRFLISSVRYDAGDGALLARLLDVYRHNGGSQDVWGHIQKAIRFMGPLAFMLQPFQKKLGRDLRHALLVYQALKTIVRQP